MKYNAVLSLKFNLISLIVLVKHSKIPSKIPYNVKNKNIEVKLIQHKQ